MKTAPTIMHVARKILEDMNFTVTPLKLQKLAYYCQAWSLVWMERPMFNEDFQAWANGPVSTELYARHKGKYSLDEDFLSEYASFSFSKEDEKTIKIVLGFYGDKTPTFLSELTHMEDPWKLGREGIPAGSPSQKIISKESIQEYYTGISTT